MASGIEVAEAKFVETLNACLVGQISVLLKVEGYFSSRLSYVNYMQVGIINYGIKMALLWLSL